MLGEGRWKDNWRREKGEGVPKTTSPQTYVYEDVWNPYWDLLICYTYTYIHIKTPQSSCDSWQQQRVVALSASWSKPVFSRTPIILSKSSLLPKRAICVYVLCVLSNDFVYGVQVQVKL